MWYFDWSKPDRGAYEENCIACKTTQKERETRGPKYSFNIHTEWIKVCSSNPSFNHALTCGNGSYLCHCSNRPNSGFCKTSHGRFWLSGCIQCRASLLGL